MVSVAVLAMEIFIFQLFSLEKLLNSIRTTLINFSFLPSELCCDMIDVVIDLSDIYGLSSEAKASQDQTAFDSQSSSLIKLNNSTILYLKEVNKFLALVCILREENFTRQGL